MATVAENMAVAVLEEKFGFLIVCPSVQQNYVFCKAQ